MSKTVALASSTILKHASIPDASHQEIGGLRFAEDTNPISYVSDCQVPRRAKIRKMWTLHEKMHRCVELCCILKMLKSLAIS